MIPSFQYATGVRFCMAPYHIHGVVLFAEVQVLMGSLLFLRQGINSSPYAHLLDPIHWAEICDIFTRDACSLLGLSVESPLSVV